MKRDFRAAPLPRRERAMLEFVETLTLAPWALARSDVVALREAGWSDGEILHIVIGCAHFNYLNRVADGLGIPLDYASELPPASVTSRTAAAEGRRGAMPGATPTTRETAWIAPAACDLPLRPDEPAHLFRAMGSNPEAAALALEWRRFQLAGTPDLEGGLRARIALFVSARSRCPYMVGWYRKSLAATEPAILDALAGGAIPSGASDHEGALLDHARRLTEAPARTEPEHIAALRRVGLDDLAILRLTLLASYLSFETRVALGLGVRPEAP